MHMWANPIRRAIRIPDGINDLSIFVNQNVSSTLAEVSVEVAGQILRSGERTSLNMPSFMLSDVTLRLGDSPHSQKGILIPILRNILPYSVHCAYRRAGSYICTYDSGALSFLTFDKVIGVSGYSKLQYVNT